MSEQDKMELGNIWKIAFCGTRQVTIGLFLCRSSTKFYQDLKLDCNLLQLRARVQGTLTAADAPMSTRPYPFITFCFFVAFPLLMTGCQPAMSNQSADAAQNSDQSSMFPLTFKVHAFQAYCYNTLACRVIYNDYNFTRLDANKPSGPTPPGDYRDDWSPASHAGIQNFPRPAEVSWTALDGSAHHVTVDIASIFKDERVLYNVPDSGIPDRSWNGEPGIFLEVDDRTVNVYMQAFIATKTEQIPGNKYSFFRTDVIRAWTHIY